MAGWLEKKMRKRKEPLIHAHWNPAQRRAVKSSHTVCTKKLRGTIFFVLFQLQWIPHSKVVHLEVTGIRTH